MRQISPPAIGTGLEEQHRGDVEVYLQAARGKGEADVAV
jgi:hypothetical protein